MASATFKHLVLPRRAIGFIQTHFRKLAALPPGRYWWRVGLEMLCLTLVISELVKLFLPETRELAVDSRLLIYMVLIAPLAETLMMVTLPANVARLFRGDIRLRCLAVVATFAILHATNSLNSLLSTGLVGGLYYGFSYIHWQKQSEQLAFWIPVAMHTLHNTVLVALYLLAMALIEIS